MSNYDKNNLRILLTRLKKLREKRPRNHHKNVGICAHVLGDLSINILAKLWLDWEHYSGREYYPIPSTNKKIKSPPEYYSKTKDLWRGKQLELRMDLINHLIKKIEKVLGGNHE